MNWLETKIPPLLLVMFLSSAMWIASKISVSITKPNNTTIMISLITVTMGLSFIIAGVVSLHQVNTTVNTTHPENSNMLVTSGIYQKTRNPMYIGFFCFLLAWAIYLGNVFSLIIACIFIPYIYRFQIQPEERMLEQLFGDKYRSYLNNVRRWI